MNVIGVIVKITVGEKAPSSPEQVEESLRAKLEEEVNLNIEVTSWDLTREEEKITFDCLMEAEGGVFEEKNYWLLVLIDLFLLQVFDTGTWPLDQLDWEKSVTLNGEVIDELCSNRFTTEVNMAVLSLLS